MRDKERLARRGQYTARFYKNNRAAFALALLATVLISLLNLVMSWLIQQIVDAVYGAEGALGLGTLAWMTVGVLLCILAFKALAYVSRPRFIARAMGQYKAFAFEKLMRKNIASFQDEATARYLSALSNDAASIETNYLDSVFDLLLNGILFLGSLAMMLVYSPLLTVIACAFFIPPALVSLLAGRRMEAAEKKISEKNESFLAALQDSLNGFPIIKSFKAEKAIIAQFGQVNDAAQEAKSDKMKLATVISALGGVTAVAAQFGTFLAGGWLILSGHDVTVGALTVFLDLTANVINPIRELPATLAARRAALGLIDKLAEELERNLPGGGRTELERLEDRIELRHVSFGYDKDHPALHDVTAVFEAGKSYAVVGASGSGKSTLLNLLMAGRGDYAGEICYDGTELREIRSDSLYDVVSMVQQNVFVFDASIRDNITMFHEFPKEDVDAAIRQSGLGALLSQRGEAYRCGENGRGLSGGERQRISIARSLLRKTSVLLVDEATAALDAENAYHVADSILRLEGLTRVVVTHALDAALLRRYDSILVMKDGRLVETGTFDDLIGAKKYFYSLYTISQ